MSLNESNPHGGLDVVIMAAGRGTRMKSQKPKVLHTLGGMSMLQRVVSTVKKLQPQSVVVVTGFGSEQVKASILDEDVHFVLQEPQLGTGHAAQQALPLLADKGTTLILNGDVPLIEAGILADLVRACSGQALALLTIELDDPTGYGRIVRAEHGRVLGIVEQKDATIEQHQIREINTGVMAVPTAHLKRWLANLKNDNAQKEYYLTDIVAMAVADGVSVVAERTKDALSVAGVNSPDQLVALERGLQQRIAHDLLRQGVRLADPQRLDVRGTLECGQDVEIDINCIFAGLVQLGDNVSIGANCVISNATIAAGAVIHPFTHIEGEKLGVKVGTGAKVGPYSRLRPGADLGEQVHVGNFVEVKNTTMAAGAKANHLAYLGDASIGEKANIGAGTITANYDGVHKHHTTVGARSSVGSNCVLVAPVELGEGATIAAGSVITRNTPADALTIARAPQTTKLRWKRPSST